MDKFLIYLVVAILTLVDKGSFGISLEDANANVTIVNTSTSYRMSMNENNHDYSSTDHLQIPLFKIVNATQWPTISAVGTMFSYAVNQTEEDSNTYIMYSTQTFDYETQTSIYQFNVMAGDDYHIVIFTIINIDDEPPTLTSPQCVFDEFTIYTNENSTCNCTVSDPDGWLGYMTFPIVNSNRGRENEIFTLEYREFPGNNTYTAPVYVTLKELLDYKKSTYFAFDIEAKDGANHSTVPNAKVRAMVSVNDLRNNPPTWTNFFTFQQFEEQQEMVFNVSARDGDSGINDPVFYVKVREDDETADYISINRTTGEIHVNKIDRDKDDISLYNFELITYVDEEREWSTNLNISFYIIDIDNNPPLVRWIVDYQTKNISFDNVIDKSTSLSFLENYDGNLNTTIFIRDIDTGENAVFSVELEMIEGSPVDYTQAFMVVPTAGYRSGEFQISVWNKTYLDYENPEWINIQFNVLTKGTKDETKTDRMLVSITLINYNDELPIFPQSEYEKKINETAEKDTFIIQVLATDRDAEDAILRHELVGSAYVNRVLRIDSDTGSIYVKVDNAFDYDTVNPIFVQVRAVDKVNHTTIVPLTIDLLDVNNKKPSISPGDPISVEENQVANLKLNSSITATDPDTTANLTAKIDWTNSYAMKNSRRLNMTNETIAQQVRFLKVQYSRMNDADHSNKDIQIDLLINDENPTQTTPDFELFDSLYLSLVVTDENTDPEFLENKDGSALILISIIDINDNTPYFPEAGLSWSDRNRTVQDSAEKGLSVGNIVAIDDDVTDTVTYDCQPMDPHFDWISVNRDTGAFTVKEANTIDADTNKTFYFNYTCTASDNDMTHTSDPLEVRFYIIDVNNKRPIVTLNETVYVDEKSKKDHLVHKIETADADRDIPFHTVQCTFPDLGVVCARKFTIVENDILVRNGGEDIDRDTDPNKGRFDCTLSCTDNPDKLQNNLSPNVLPPIEFQIVLNDINDHTPVLDMGDLTVWENIVKDETIGMIVATDIDEGLNAAIDFNLTSATKVGDDDDETDYTFLFEISKNESDYEISDTHKQAHLIALEDLKGHYGTYNISVGLRDQGTPQQSCINSTLLHIGKFNFEQPRFIYPAHGDTFLLQSTPKIGSQLVFAKNSSAVRDFAASDNIDSNCTKWNITFSLKQISPESDIDIFTLQKQSAACTTQLQVTNAFGTRGLLDTLYNLKLTARVKEGEEMPGEKPYSTDININVTFLNNSQEPIFEKTEWSVTFLENDTSQSLALEHPAKFPLDDSFPKYYYLVTANKTIEDIFKVDQDDGTLGIKQKIIYEHDKRFTFDIVASKDSTTSSSNPLSYLHVTVTVIGTNKYTPQWTKTVFFAAILPGYIRNTPVLTIEATDADDIDQGRLTYDIISDIERKGSGLDILTNPFIITPNTGEIKLNFSVDTTMNGYFKFQVSVQDQPDGHGNGPRSNTTTVTVFIITSDKTIKFRFSNTVEEVMDNEVKMLDIISGILNTTAYTQLIDSELPSGDEGNISYASLYFIESTDSDDGVTAVDVSTINRMVSTVSIYNKLASQLRNQAGLILLNFPSNGSASDNTTEVLRAWLVGVSTVLGALCLVLLTTFILKTRQLNNRIAKLTTHRFGSQESGLNRLGVVPTTNKHALEGSNPVFSSNDPKKEKDLADFDRHSIKSGDSDLIGVEDNPEFDYNFKEKINDGYI